MNTIQAILMMVVLSAASGIVALPLVKLQLAFMAKPSAVKLAFISLVNAAMIGGYMFALGAIFNAAGWPHWLWLACAGAGAVSVVASTAVFGAFYWFSRKGLNHQEG